MSAQHIPNLLSLRGSPSRSRGGRGRPLRRQDETDVIATSLQRKDLDIQSTDTDAAVSRLSAVNLGYLQDDYAMYFVTGPATRRQPLINRGTYTRTTALDILIDAFISEGGAGSVKQIISLGAGTDTRYFRLRAQSKTKNVVYHELDFPSVSAAKFRTVSTNERLARGEDGRVLFPEIRPGTSTGLEPDTEWGFTHGNDEILETMYCFHPVDLRRLPHSTTPFRGLRQDLSTLIISECCLCYMEVASSSDIMRWFMDKVQSIGVVLYEPIGANDSFGQMMVSNLAARNIVMPSLQQFKTLSDQKERLVNLGFQLEVHSGQAAESIEMIWNKWVPATEKDRLDRLEGLDEVEEWQMLASHYALVWGWRGNGWSNWANLGANT